MKADARVATMIAMLAKRLTWAVLTLLLLLGAVSAAPAAMQDRHAATTVELASVSADHLTVSAAGGIHDVNDHVHETPPLFAQMPVEMTMPRWTATWSRSATSTGIVPLLAQPDEPPRHLS